MRSGEFPGQRFSPYKIPDDEADALAQALLEAGLDDAAAAVVDAPVDDQGDK